MKLKLTLQRPEGPVDLTVTTDATATVGEKNHLCVGALRAMFGERAAAADGLIVHVGRQHEHVLCAGFPYERRTLVDVRRVKQAI